MDVLPVEIRLTLYHQVGRGFFSFGGMWPIDPVLAATTLSFWVTIPLDEHGSTGHVHAWSYVRLAKDVQLDNITHANSSQTDDAAVFSSCLRRALRDLVSLARICVVVRNELQCFSEHIYTHARLAARFVSWYPLGDRLCARIRAIPTPSAEEQWAIIAAIGQIHPMEVLAGKPVGPNRRIARGKAATASYILVKRGTYRIAEGSALNSDEQPVFKLGAEPLPLARRYVASHCKDLVLSAIEIEPLARELVIDWYKERRRLEDHLKAEKMLSARLARQRIRGEKTKANQAEDAEQLKT